MTADGVLPAGSARRQLRGSGAAQGAGFGGIVFLSTNHTNHTNGFVWFIGRRGAGRLREAPLFVWFV